MKIFLFIKLRDKLCDKRNKSLSKDTNKMQINVNIFQKTHIDSIFAQESNENRVNFYFLHPECGSQ